MKKIFLFAAVAVSALLCSCEMEKEPEGAIKSDETIINPINARYFRNGFYNSFRGLCNSALNNYAEVQMDNFQALAPNYGNTLGNIFKGDFTSSTSDFAGAFSLFYGNIGPLNYYLPLLEELIESDEWSTQDHMKMIRYRGETHFLRAYNYYYLTQYFCQDYTEANKDNAASGVPLVTVFNPTTDRSVYPGRSTLAETYKLILDDLDQAEADLTAFEATLTSSSDEYEEMMVPGAGYINTSAIKAFRARIALAMGEKDKAYTLASELINSGKYELANANAYANLWQGTPGEAGYAEIILRCIVTQSEAEALGQTNSLFYSYNTSQAMYIPSNATINMYSGSDVRSTWIDTEFQNLNGEWMLVPVFAKYIGLQMFSGKSASRGCYMAYPFRLAELYLIAAECAPNVKEQNRLLKILRQARGLSYPARDYSATAIVNQIRTERNRELIGEGFRLTDLRRYGQGFTRDAATPQPNFPKENFNILYFVQGYDNLSYEPDDHRFVWPIPSDEIQVNPQIVGQQNPGY